jgi:hypothetical protein
MAIRVKTVHRLKVTLLQVKPPVWRRIEVASNIKLAELSGVLEAAMGWLGAHLHAFKVDGVLYEIPDDDSFGFPPPRDERKARLGDVLPVVTSKMRWDYDFGDGWEHDVVVESIEPMKREGASPVCVAGKRACPPDDCGGPRGYSNLLAAIGDPTHEEHEALSQWLPPGFDANEFDIALATEMMRSAMMRSARPLTARPLRGW